MEIGIKAPKVLAVLKKHRYSVLIVLIGLIFMIVPSKSKQSNPQASTKQVNETKELLEERLANILSKVEYAGKVEVILTRLEGEEIIYQTDDDSSIGASANASRSNTVTITNSERDQSGLVKQVNPESYRGAIVLCQGADNPTVRLAIVDAVTKVTGLGANEIAVLKMK